MSSSAHVSLLPWFAGWRTDDLDPETRKSFEVALHTYFAVLAAGAVAVKGLGGCTYADKVAGGALPRQDGTPIRF